MGWDPNMNTVQAFEEVWALYFMEKQVCKPFSSKGCAHYDLLGVIFNNITATGQMQYISTHSPPDSDVERELENDFPITGAHIGLNTKWFKRL
ncbi:hypothetical protein ACE6H2_026079 [Prunus campanulata]